MNNKESLIAAGIVVAVLIGGIYFFTSNKEVGEIEYKAEVISIEEQATITWLKVQLEEKQQKLKVEELRLELATEINILLEKQKATSNAVLEIVGLSGYAEDSL